MRIAARLVCALVGHQPSGGRATYDTAAESFVDVATTEYATCTRCGDVRPAPLTVVDGATAGERTARTPGHSNASDEDGSAKGDERGLEEDRSAKGDERGLKEDEGAEREPSESESENETHVQAERGPDGDRAVSTTR